MPPSARRTAWLAVSCIRDMDILGAAEAARKEGLVESAAGPLKPRAGVLGAKADAQTMQARATRTAAKVCIVIMDEAKKVVTWVLIS